MNVQIAFPECLGFSAANPAIASMTEVLTVKWAEHGIG
jgi:hypothetical protein